jgi:HD-GYP domain-containing protein (c-di-GMP phosphodiesterase class II)
MAYGEEKVNLKAIFTSLTEALEVSDPYTRGHSDRVGSLAVALGMEVGLSHEELELLKDAGALHDIGKIGVSSDILHKPGRLTDAEWEAIKKHPEIGYNILRPLKQERLLELTLYHHERIDGKGYPEGLTEYPLLVRVLQIADVWDALTSDRPYRAAMSYSTVRKMMSSGDTFGFDPQLLESFLRLTRFIFPDDDCDTKAEMADLMKEIAELQLDEDLGRFGTGGNGGGNGHG